MSANVPAEALTKKDFTSNQEVRWCPGCGDYAILAAIQRTLPAMGSTPDSTAFISGIGCSSRFPYYMETYGFHTIHGRAPAIASGVKLANPELDVWVITGDGDSLSIGGNHLLHALRRNIDLNIVMFNNEIYGLTKGQYSPTSKVGVVSPSSPYGSLDEPITPARFALGASTRFFARGHAVSKQLPELLKRAQAHKGASLIEVLQNCPVFNDGVFDQATNKKEGTEHRIEVEHGKPLIFGKLSNKGLRLNPQTLDLEVVVIGEDGITEADIQVHDEANKTLAWLLSELPEVVAFGVLYCDPTASYDTALRTQIDETTERLGVGDLDALMRQGHTWTVE